VSVAAICNPDGIVRGMMDRDMFVNSVHGSQSPVQ